MAARHAERLASGADALRRNRLREAIEVLEPLRGLSARRDVSLKARRLLANSYMKLQDYPRAEQAARDALEIAPRDTEAVCTLLAIYNNWGKYDRAYEIAREIDPAVIPDTLIHAFCQATVKQGDYAKFNELGDVYARLEHVDPAQIPSYLGINGMRNRLFDAASLERYQALQRRWGAHMMAQAAERPLPEATRRRARANAAADGRLRLGFYALSNIFDTQAVLTPILKHLDRATFQPVFAFIENGPGVVTAESFTSLFEEVVTIPRGGARDAAIKLAELGCDIVIDLNGLQQPATRVDALAWRVAPVQLSWTGRPISCGLPALDYNIVDTVLAGDGRGCLNDTLNLSGAFACFGPMPAFELPERLPSEATGTVTFAINAEPAKFNLRTIDMWAAVLRARPAARAVFLRPEYASGYLRENIAAAFEARGVDPARIAFWYEAPAERRGHMRHYNHVDVLLDGYPMTGGIGMLEALHMGVPAVSLEGPAIQLRVGASHLHAVGLDDLRTDSVDAYVATAVRLADDVDRRRRLRPALRPRLSASAFVDVDRFAGDFNAALQRLAGRHFDRSAGTFSPAPIPTPTPATQEAPMANQETVTIDGVQYPVSALSEEAQTQLANLRATDQEIQRLRTQLGIAQTARQAYANALKAALPGASGGES